MTCACGNGKCPWDYGDTMCLHEGQSQTTVFGRPRQQPVMFRRLPPPPPKQAPVMLKKRRPTGNSIQQTVPRRAPMKRHTESSPCVSPTLDCCFQGEIVPQKRQRMVADEEEEDEEFSVIKVCSFASCVTHHIGWLSPSKLFLQY